MVWGGVSRTHGWLGAQPVLKISVYNWDGVAHNKRKGGRRIRQLTAMSLESSQNHGLQTLSMNTPLPHGTLARASDRLCWLAVEAMCRL